MRFLGQAMPLGMQHLHHPLEDSLENLHYWKRCCCRDSHSRCLSNSINNGMIGAISLTRLDEVLGKEIAISKARRVRCEGRPESDYGFADANA